ncbi:DUF3157 family protein [Flavobacterium sp. N3904]|uniref:DUF3157 family protein n=1 Tax=Flavobacterium sp. N3904 TaxID=2986835 RepID=UPI0022254065|nr:DUF3157 family protein [Flavobacterium sp. N3904]
MRKSILYCLLLTSSIALAQSETATTASGKKVVLKADKTWEYVDVPVISTEKKIPGKVCDLEENFVEPKSDKGINSWLKRYNATTDYLKKQVAKENNCSINDVTLLTISEQKENGTYSLCAKGTEMKYQRIGFAFSKAD